MKCKYDLIEKATLKSKWVLFIQGGVYWVQKPYQIPCNSDQQSKWTLFIQGGVYWVQKTLSYSMQQWSAFPDCES